MSSSGWYYMVLLWQLLLVAFIAVMAGGDVHPLLVGSREGVQESRKPQSISVPTSYYAGTVHRSSPLYSN